MSWKLRTYAGVGQWLRSKGVDAVQVVGIDEQATGVGVTTRITYIDHYSHRNSTDYAGSLSDIINGA